MNTHQDIKRAILSIEYALLADNLSDKVRKELEETKQKLKKILPYF